MIAATLLFSGLVLTSGTIGFLVRRHGAGAAVVGVNDRGFSLQRSAAPSRRGAGRCEIDGCCARAGRRGSGAGRCRSRTCRPGRSRLLVLAVGLIGLPLGADFLVDGRDGASRMSHRGLGDGRSGLTLVAIGTSLPELATTVDRSAPQSGGCRDRQRDRVEHLQCHGDHRCGKPWSRRSMCRARLLSRDHLGDDRGLCRCWCPSLLMCRTDRTGGPACWMSSVTEPTAYRRAHLSGGSPFALGPMETGR